MATPQLATRKPTGAVPWPFVLVEGPEKAGKSWAIAELSTSDRVGTVYWIDLGEGSADEYGAIDGADYEVVVHDGSWWSIVGQIDAVTAEAQRAQDAGERPVVLAIDSGTGLWELLKGWADQRARQRRNKGPNDEVTISMDLWNDAGARHAALITKLHRFPGIVVVTARGKEVAALDDNGRPVEGQKVYKVEGQKNLAYDATVWVRMSREHPPLIVGARSVHYGVKPGKDDPRRTPPDFTLDRLIFDVLRCDPAKAHVRDVKELSGGELSESESGPGPETTTTARRPGPRSARSAEQAATRLLDADNAKRVEWLVGKVADNGDGQLDAGPFVTEDDRDTLGLASDAEVTLDALSKSVTAYWQRHGFGPRHQPDPQLEEATA